MLGEGSGCLWTISEKEVFRGYFFAEIVPTEYETRICLVHQVMVKGNKKIIREIESVVEKWAIENGVHEMAFFTRRKPEAFIRSTGRKWEVDSVVLKRKI